ncbi:MAG: hypothetical protein MUE52_16140 [Tabrizicola sp.]|nr:hypothetical protein [Tabrizicola sp.]
MTRKPVARSWLLLVPVESSRSGAVDTAAALQALAHLIERTNGGQTTEPQAVTAD